MTLNVIIALAVAALLLWRAGPHSLRDVLLLAAVILLVCALRTCAVTPLPTPAASAAGDTRPHVARSAVPARRGLTTYPLAGARNVTGARIECESAAAFHGSAVWPSEGAAAGRGSLSV
jgi:hypothetical protein